MKTPEELKNTLWDTHISQWPALLTSWRDEAVEEAHRLRTWREQPMESYTSTASQSPAPEGGDKTSSNPEAKYEDNIERWECLAVVKGFIETLKIGNDGIKDHILYGTESIDYIEAYRSTLLARAPRAEGWISVKDRKPADCTSVLICNMSGQTQDDRDARIGWWETTQNKEGGCWVVASPNVWNEVQKVRNNMAPTHWMPLPSPPKEDAQ